MGLNAIIIDYGVGNIRSVQRALAHLDIDSQISSDPDTIRHAELLVLPGQGAFETAIHNLRSRGLDQLVIDHVNEERPFLGICVGFQILFEGSEENGTHQGLDLFPGIFKHFPDIKGLPVPHMGWNTLQMKSEPLFDMKEQRPNVYFVHSYYLDQTRDDIILAQSDYGIPFVAAIQQKNLLATQFHPEKSGKVGLNILKEFIRSIS